MTYHAIFVHKASIKSNIQRIQANYITILIYNVGSNIVRNGKKFLIVYDGLFQPNTFSIIWYEWLNIDTNDCLKVDLLNVDWS